MKWWLQIGILFLAFTHSRAQLPFNPDTVQFKRVEYNPVIKQHNLMEVDENGVVWFGNYGVFQCFGNHWLKFNSFDDVNSNSVSPVVVGITKDTSGNIFIPYLNAGFSYHNIYTKFSQHVIPSKTGAYSTFSDRIFHRGVIPFRNDTLILCTVNGIGFYNMRTHKTQDYIKPKTKEGQEEKTILYVLPDPNNKNMLWVDISGTQQTYLAQVDIKTGQVKKRIFSERNETARELAFFGDKILKTGKETGYLFMDTIGNQKFKFTYENENAISPFAEKDITRNYYIGDSVFLFSGAYNAGLFDYNTEEYHFFNLPILDSKEHDPYYKDCLVDNAGCVWITSHWGVFKSVHPLLPKKKDPIFGFISFESNQTSLTYPILKETAFTINEHDSLKIKFGLFNPAYPNNIEYQYKMKGVNNVWTNIGSQDSLLFNSLRSGNYQLDLKAKDIDGKEYFLQFNSIKVIGPIYSKTWFLLLSTFILSSLFYLLYRNQIIRIRTEERVKAEFQSKMDKLEIAALRSQMNPHFIFNSMNSIKNYLIKKGPDEAADYLTGFATLIRTILENSKQDSISLEKEIKSLELYLDMENKRLEKALEWNIEVDEDIDRISTKLPPMLLQPYIENAIWHGLMPKSNDRKLTIQFLKIDEGFLCIIEDNGIGRKAASERSNGSLKTKKSLGTYITQQRIDSINRTKNSNIKIVTKDLIQDKKAKGTRVQISIKAF